MQEPASAPSQVSVLSIKDGLYLAQWKHGFPHTIYQHIFAAKDCTTSRSGCKLWAPFTFQHYMAALL
jgi:hypothetical protein